MKECINNRLSTVSNRSCFNIQTRRWQRMSRLLWLCMPWECFSDYLHYLMQALIVEPHSQNLDAHCPVHLQDVASGLSKHLHAETHSLLENKERC